jgi:hypothetical protein
MLNVLVEITSNVGTKLLGGSKWVLCKRGSGQRALSQAFFFTHGMTSHFIVAGFNYLWNRGYIAC